ncbi:hypothetical protein FQA39_LY11253 [Lamprigera yunnana]|nr:hypothetical protein FQA39_LY11253 [Lamprigera yunnana]
MNLIEFNDEIKRMKATTMNLEQTEDDSGVMDESGVSENNVSKKDTGVDQKLSRIEELFGVIIGKLEHHDRLFEKIDKRMDFQVNRLDGKIDEVKENCERGIEDHCIENEPISSKEYSGTKALCL